jgi:phospholipid-binding lipoprotein MlaA
VRAPLAALALVLSAGCASTSGDTDPRDPFEGLNRRVYRFNEVVDVNLAQPVARGYRRVVPGELRDRVRNFFGNIGDVFTGVNNFLQGKFEDGVSDWARVAFNTTIGLFGVHDVATDMGYEKHNEDFGQTFGRWGARPGPYLVLPLLGSSDLRDALGTGVDIYADPLASRILEEAALDKYVFQRDAYLQRRRSLVYDGHPPREKEPEDDEPKKPR